VDKRTASHYRPSELRLQGHTYLHRAMLTATLLVIWKLLLPLLLVIAVIDWLTASDDRRVRILRRTGLTQQQIADRLNLSRYRVRKALAS
jgi:DNA-binding NarL/FixJ family response regulator